MCLVAFQKNFRKIFSDVWLCSWKYHRKHIFYLLLIFSRLPNEYIISFISQNTNKTQKKIIKFEHFAQLRSARSALCEIDGSERCFARSRWRSWSDDVIDALWDRTVDHNLAKYCSRQSRSTLREIASSIAIRDRSVHHEIVPCSSGFVRVFLGFASSFFFSNFFSKRQKIFFEKYFEMQPNTWKHFPFRKIAFPKNGIFSENAFTRTKHSLIFVYFLILCGGQSTLNSCIRSTL